MTWYEDKIEEPVRDIVELLRNNGFNTECSCGHEMYIQCRYVVDHEFHELHRLIYNYLLEKGEKISFEIEMTHKVVDGKSYSHFDIRFPTLKSTKEWMEKKKEYYAKMQQYFEEQVKLVDENIKNENWVEEESTRIRE